MPRARFSTRTIKTRAHALELVLFASLGILLGRAFFLQVVRGDEFRQLADENRVRIEVMPAPRGTILDRNGAVIAENRPSYTVFFDAGAKRVASNDSVASPGSVQSLDVVLGMSKPEIDRMAAVRGTVFRPLRLKRNVPFERVCYLEEHKSDYPAIQVQIEPARFYPNGTAAAHVVGYIGGVSKEELESGLGYQRDDYVGKFGLEKYYEKWLRGKEGARYVEVDALGRKLRQLPQARSVPPRAGDRVVTTLDIELQKAAESLFDREGYTGVLLAMDPFTGEVLVSVSRPAFDPNEFASGLSRARWEELVSDPGHPLLNRVSQAAYPPGSVFKLIVAYAGLAERLIEPSTVLSPCRGTVKIGDRAYRCWKEEGHGALDLKEAIAQSCDVYFYQLGMQLGVDKIAKYAKLFGLDEAVVSDLHSVKRSTVPDGTWYDRVFGKRKWSRGIAANLAIGQGELTVTPVALASAVCTIANGGYRIKPHFMRRIVDADGRVWAKGKVVPERIEGIKTEYLDFLREAMIWAVESEHGTARFGRVEGLSFGGKTSTIENPHGEDHSVFVAFAPSGKPSLVVLALIEHGGHGAERAVPLVAKFLETWKRMRPPVTAQGESSLEKAEG